MSHNFQAARIKRLEALVAILLARSARAGGGGSSFNPFAPLPFTELFVDPQDVTGHASDSNPGTSPSAPLLTTDHASTLLVGQLTAATTIAYLSPDNPGHALELGYLSLGSFNLFISQTPQTQHTGGVLDAGTVAMDPLAGGGGQRQTLHTSDLASWLPFVTVGRGGAATDGCYLLDTTAGPRVGNFSWIATGSGATASASFPTDAGVTVAGAVDIGDSYRIQSGGRLNLAFGAPPATDGGQIFVSDCAFDASFAGGQELLFSATYTRCSWQGNNLPPGFYQSCFADSGMVGTIGGRQMTAGLLVCVPLTDEVTSPLTLTADVYITGSGMDLSPFGYAAVFVTRGFGIGGLQFQDMSGDAAIIVDGAVNLATGNCKLWGNGNAGPGINIAPGGSLYVASTVVADRPSVTGSSDYAFSDAPGGGFLLLARPWDNVGNAYATERATTWPNFFAAIGAGGFGSQAHNVATGAQIVGL